MSDLSDATDAVNAAALVLSNAATASTDANTATVELAADLDARIATALTDADANVIIPVMSMYSGQVKMAASLAKINASFITLITPPEA
jgi:exonuclease I